MAPNHVCESDITQLVKLTRIYFAVDSALGELYEIIKRLDLSDDNYQKVIDQLNVVHDRLKEMPTFEKK